MTVFPEWVLQLPCSDFVSWVDREHREAVLDRVRRAQFGRATVPELELYEAWGELLAMIYAQGWTAERWREPSHLFAYCVSVVRTWRRRLYCRRRIRTWSNREATEHVLISELTEERLAELRAVPDERSSYVAQLGSSVGWLGEALAALSPARREALMLCVCAGMSKADAAESLGVTQNALMKACSLGVQQLRAEASGREYRIVGGRVVYGDGSIESGRRKTA